MKNVKKFIATVLVFCSRFGVLPANFSPLGGFGFFGNNVFLYFATIVLYDVIKGGFYAGFLFTYLGFLGYFILGRLARNKLKRQLFLLPVASFSFFLISNLGVWLYWYPHTLAGLTQCYMLALPFYRNTLLGDLTFGYGYLVFKFLSKKNYSRFLNLIPIARQ